jgi:hypothetical protein
LHPRILGLVVCGEIGLTTWIFSSKCESVAMKVGTIIPSEESRFSTMLNVMNRAKQLEFGSGVHVLSCFVHPAPEHEIDCNIDCDAVLGNGKPLQSAELHSIYRWKLDMTCQQVRFCKVQRVFMALHLHEAFLTCFVKV